MFSQIYVNNINILKSTLLPACVQWLPLSDANPCAFIVGAGHQNGSMVVLGNGSAKTARP